MRYHILNGDALAEKFPEKELLGQVVVIREAFIEGPLAKIFSEEFWENRIDFVLHHYEAEREAYENQFLSQLRILDTIRNDDKVYLWFEDDLFCLVNLLFVIVYLSKKSKATLFRVFPEKDDKRWKGFGHVHEKEIIHLFEHAIAIDNDDIKLAEELWEAYITDDRGRLRALSFSDTHAFRFLPQVIQAHLDRNPEDGSNGRPQQTLIDILNEGKTNFYEIFDDFWKKEAIYGFGDLQVYNMLKEMEIDLTGEPDEL